MDRSVDWYYLIEDKSAHRAEVEYDPKMRSAYFAEHPAVLWDGAIVE